ncbi:MAG: WD40/YVTN/BNR-like repeat-containing protein, partial [Gemmatimonas sp.]
KPQPPKGDSAYRWDWDAPLVASRHTAGTVYIGGNRLFISKDFGSTWTRTDDLTRKINRDTLTLMGVRDKDIKIAKNDGESTFSELTAIAESPIDAKVLWVGTDDGNVQLSTDGGKTWRELSAAITTAGIHDGSYVSRIVASGASRGTAYVAFDQHRVGDFAPYIARTTDFGKTWKPITTGLPNDGSVRSIQEYPGKANVIFAGTERYLFVSNDSGARWTRLAANLPTTRYDDIVVHPRTKDLVLATHGRSIWILDDASPIADWSATIAAKPSHLFPVPRATLLQYWEDISNTAHSMYAAENPAEGATFTYHLAKPAQKVQLIVRGPGGKVIRELAGSASPGVLHRVSWDLRHAPPPASAGAGGFGVEEGGGPPEAGGAGGGRAGRPRAVVVQLPIPTHDIGSRGPYVAPGTYTIALNVDGDTTSRTFEVRADPAGNVTLAQHKARETFLVDVQSLQVQTEERAVDLRSRRAETTGADSSRLVALERRLTGGRDGVRAKLGGVARFFNGTGAQQGSFLPPTTTQRQVVAEAKAELMAVEKELKAFATAK